MHFTAFAQSARFHLYGFQGPSLWYLLDLNCRHIASESLETFHTSPHHCLDLKKLSLDHWWCTGLRFLEFTYGSNIVPLSFMWLNSWKFENASKLLETLHEWVNRSSLLKRLSSEYPGYIVLHLQSLQDLTYMSFKGLLCGIFVNVESDHNASESVESFHAWPNHCLEVKRLSLGHWWCTGRRFLEFTYGSNILPLSFMWLNSWKFENCIEMAWNFSQMTEWVVVAEQT